MNERSATTLAATKLTPPTLPGRLVERSRLSSALDASLAGQVKLVLASAPAGSGKSTLLAAWLADRPEPSAWLQVEPSDSDPTRFWLHLTEAIALTRPELRARLEPVVVSSNGDGDLVVTALVNELASLTDLIVVIDDYHLIDNADIHDGMERLIELCPPSVTIVIATRVDPPFRLGRLRVRGQLAEVRGSDVRFAPEEAAALLSSDPIDGTIVHRLVDRTEGWAAGLVLAGLSLRQSPDPEEFIDGFHGDDQLVVDYITDEFLAGESDEQRQRLLETAILEQFDGELVDAVTGTTGGKKWLLDTAKTNQLLISLDRTNTWFRYHHLFRDLLRLEAERAFPDRLGELHQRAAEWFESHDDHRPAVMHHLAAGNHDDAIRLVYLLAPQLIADSQIGTLRDVLTAIGEPATKDPSCALSWGWCEYIAGHYSAADAWVTTTHEVGGPGLDQIITAPLRMNLSLARGDVSSALELAREVNAQARSAEHRPELSTTTGGSFMWAGESDEAAAVLDVAIEKSATTHFRSTHLLALILLAINAFDRDGRAREASTAIDTAADLGMSSYHRLAPAYAIRARGTDDPDEARADAIHAVELARRAPGQLALAFVLATCGDTLLDLGDTEGRALLTEARSVVDRCPDPGIAGRLVARLESKHDMTTARPHDADVLIDDLTDRELAVLRFLPTSLSQREIGSELFVSANTVKTHCSAIYRKLGVSDRKAAVQTARDLGLL